MAASVSLLFKSNFDEAEEDFKSLSTTSVKETEKITRALGKIEAKQLDAVIDKHKRLAVSITATRGKQEAFIIQQRNLRNEIEKQIRLGMDPQDERLKKIRAEYERVTISVEENRAATKKHKEALKAQEKALKDQEDQVKKNKVAQEQMNAVLQRSYMALLAGVGLTTAALAKNTFEVAANGAEYLKASKMIGITAEEYQELNFVAGSLNITQERFNDALVDMTEKIGEARVGSGTLNDHLKETNPILLEQIKNTTDSGVAFDLLMQEMRDTTNEQDRMILSTELFSDAGKDMISIANLSAEEVKNLREEARKYGIISNEAAEQSALFVKSQKNLSASVTGLKNKLGVELLPMFDNTVNAMVDFIGAFDDEEIDQFGESVKFIFNGLLLSGGVVAKGMNDVFSLANANIDQSVKNTFKVVQKISDFVATQAESWSTVLDFLGADVTGLENMANSVRTFEQTMSGAEVAARKSQEESVLSWERRNAVIVEYMKTIDKALTAENEIGSGSSGGGGKTPFVKVEKVKEEDEAAILRKKLRLLENEEAISNAIRVQEFQRFFEARAEQEGISAEDKIAFLQDEMIRIKELDTIDKDEKIQAQIALNETMDELRKDQVKKDRQAAEAKLAIAERGLAGAQSISNSLKSIMKEDAKAQRDLAIVDKGIAIARIAIDTQRAIAASLAITPLPYGLPAVVANGAVGLAAGIAVAAEPIPTAETGTNFVVPDTGRSNFDNVAVKASAGEEVNVTPRGESPKRMTSVVVQIGERAMFDVVQEGIDGGSIIITTDNVRGLVA